MPNPRNCSEIKVEAPGIESSLKCLDLRVFEGVAEARAGAGYVKEEDTFATEADQERSNGGMGRRMTTVATLAREVAGLAGVGDVDGARVLVDAIDRLLEEAKVEKESAAMQRARHAAERGAAILDLALARAAVEGRRQRKLR